MAQGSVWTSTSDESRPTGTQSGHKRTRADYLREFIESKAPIKNADGKYLNARSIHLIDKRSTD